jgi:hypothetical protein
VNNSLTLCMAYLDKLPVAQSGAGGHNATLRAALATRRFGLSQLDAWQAMTWFNRNRCSPEWSEKELRHKLASVADLPIKKPLGQRQHTPARRVRAFVAPAPLPEPEPDLRPVIERSEQEEETWWAQWAVEHGTTLEEFDKAVGNA